MRRTLSFLFVVLFVIVTLPAQGSWVSEMLFGRHREYHEAGITYAVDEKIPARWMNDSALSTRYWREGAPVFAGTVLEISVILNTGTQDGRIFAICASNRDCVVGDLSGRENFKYDLNRDRLGGLQILGTFVGKYGIVELDTTSIEPGTVFLYTFALKSRKYEKFSEKVIAIRIAPPLEEVLPAMQYESEEVLRAWGLESYLTLEEVVGAPDCTPSRFDILFSDGGQMSDVRISGKPSIGRYMGVYKKASFPENQIAIIKVKSVDGSNIGGEIVPTHGAKTSKDLYKALNGCEDRARLEWLYRIDIYSTGECRDLTSKEREYLDTFPEDGPVGSPTYGLRNAVMEMATAEKAVVHLTRKYIPNTSADYWRMYQVWTASKHAFVLAPTEAYVPESKMREVRVVRLAPGGVPVVKIEPSEVTKLDTDGLWRGVAIIIGQRVRRPNRINVLSESTATGGSATATATQWQEQQQEQQQEQAVTIDP